MSTFLKKNQQAGFTLIETLIAVLILATSIAGPLTIASKSLTTALVAKDQISAFFLAQDAVEYVRFARDSNKRASTNWLTGSGGTETDLSPCNTVNGCYIDSTNNSPTAPTACSAAGCPTPTLNYDSTNSRFTYAAVAAGISKTIYTRTITLTQITTAEYRVTVTVSWSGVGTAVRSVTVSEYIYNWQ